jgi:transcriptional regulator with XRE-family HTH domain
MGKDGNSKNPFAVRAGHRIRASRKSRNWSQSDLSEKTGGKLSASRIANYEQGLRELDIQVAEILGHALKVQPAFLMGVTNLKTQLSPLEEELVNNYRALPENARQEYFQRIEALALAYKTPVPDERLGEGWQAPTPPEPPVEQESVKKRRRKPVRT